MIKVERGKAWSISDCLYGDEDKKPNIEFINEVNKYEGLKEAILGIENLISGRSIHAAGVILYNNGYIEGNNAIMRSKNGQIITAYTMNDSESVGNLKIDLLTVETLDKIRTCMDLLVKDNLIEKKDTLKETYENCLHPNKLIYNNPNI
jgi:DNA polymerase-3 subunit alpha